MRMEIPLLKKLIEASLQIDQPIKLIAFVIIILFSIFWVLFSKKEIPTLTENRLKLLFKIIDGIIILALVGSTLLILVPLFRQNNKPSQATSVEKIEPFNNEKFGILITNFNNDGGKHINASLRAILNTRFQKLGISDAEAREISSREIKTPIEARKIGKEYNADLVIWGDKTLNGVISNVTLISGDSEFVNVIKPNSTSEVLDSQLTISNDITIPELTNDPIRTVCFVTGVKYYNEKSYDEALKYLTQSLGTINSKLSDNVPIYYLIGIIHLDKEDPLKALQAFNHAVDLDPNEYRSYSNRAVVFKITGKFAEAEADLKKSLALNKIDPMTFMNLGNVYRQKSLYAQAIENYDKALALSNNDQTPQILINKGLVYWMSGKPDEAINIYMEAIKIKPDLSTAYRNIGSAYIDKKDYDQAIKYLNLAIKFEPTYANAYVGRSTANYLQGNKGKAVLDISEAVKLDPSFDNYLRRAELWSNLKKHDEALKDYSKALELNAKNIEALNNRGRTLALQKDYTNAVIDFKKAIESSPNNATSYYHLGLTYKMLGKFCDSLENYERFYSLANPQSPEDSPALQVIKNEIEFTKSRCLENLK